MKDKSCTWYLLLYYKYIIISIYTRWQNPRSPYLAFNNERTFKYALWAHKLHNIIKNLKLLSVYNCINTKVLSLQIHCKLYMSHLQYQEVVRYCNFLDIRMLHPIYTLLYLAISNTESLNLPLDILSGITYHTLSFPWLLSCVCSVYVFMYRQTHDTNISPF